MELTSSAFTEGGPIPKPFTRDGANKSPALSIEGVPTGTKSLVLIMDDPDAPQGTFTHWILFNMSPTTREIHEDAAPVMATQGKNDGGSIGYTGPNPSSGEHHYNFHLYALDTVLSLPRGSSRVEVDAAMQSNLLDEAILTGVYSRSAMVGA